MSTPVFMISLISNETHTKSKCILFASIKPNIWPINNNPLFTELYMYV